MTLIQLIYLLVIFFFIVGLSYVFLRLLGQRPTKKRLEILSSDHSNEIKPNEYGKWEHSVSKIVRPFASLSLPTEGWEKSPLSIRFMHAGYRARSLPIFYFGSKTVLALIFPTILFSIVGLARLDYDTSIVALGLLTATTIGYYLPNMILARKIFLRQREIFENFPDAIDLITVCVEAGLGLDAAMTKVGEEMYVKCMPIAEEFNLVNLEIKAGRSREGALRNLALRTGVEEIEGLVSMLIQADRFGTNIAVSLRIHSDMLRTKRRLKVEEVAGKIALKLLFPLIIFLFPALMVVIIGPGAINIVNVLFPAMAAS